MAKELEVSTEKKITSKIVLAGTGILRKLAADAKPEVVYTVGGVVQDFQLGSGTYGEYCKFLGDFKAIRKSDGQVFKAPAAFFPEPFSGIFRRQIEDFKRKNQDAGMEVVIEVSIRPHDNKSGYEYVCKSLLTEAAKSGADSVFDKVKLLDGPKK